MLTVLKHDVSSSWCRWHATVPLTEPSSYKNLAVILQVVAHFREVRCSGSDRGGSNGKQYRSVLQMNFCLMELALFKEQPYSAA